MATGYDDGMPSNYDNQINERPTSGIIDMDFLRSLRGILKGVQTVLSLIALICGCVWGAGDHILTPSGASGWTQFVVIAAFIIVVVIDVLYLFGIPAKMSPGIPFNFAELVVYVVFVLFYFITGVIAAVYGSRHSSVAATAFFAFACFVAFAVDIYFCFMAWRMSGEGPALFSSSSSGAQTTTSSRSVDVPKMDNPQY